MFKFIIVILATMAVCWAAFCFTPTVSHTAFHVGNFPVSWMMLLLVGSFFGMWKTVHGK